MQHLHKGRGRVSGTAFTFFVGIALELSGMTAPVFAAILFFIGGILFVLTLYYWLQDNFSWLRSVRFVVYIVAFLLGVVMFFGSLMVSKPDALVNVPEQVIVVLSELGYIEASISDLGEVIRQDSDVIGTFPPPDIGVVVHLNANNANIIITNNSQESVRILPIATVLGGRGSTDVGQPFYVKWQGGFYRTERIPKGGLATLNVASFGIPSVVLGLGTDLCLNFLVSQQQTNNGRAYLPMGCQSAFRYDGENNKEILIEYQLKLVATSVIDPLAQTEITRVFQVTPGQNRNSIGFAEIQDAPIG